MLNEWWDTNTKTNRIHDYEQAALTQLIGVWNQSSDAIEILKEKTLVAEKNQLFQHVASNRENLRTPIMEQLLKELLCS